MSARTFHPDRAAGVLLGQACGNALGVPYEFGPSLPASFEPQMAGGGPFGFDPGEYSDDTSMAVCIAEVASRGADLTSDDALDEIAEGFLAWAAVSKDVGAQTSRVFSATRKASTTYRSVGWRMRHASAALAAAQPGQVGNGALMRTSVVGLTRLDDREGTAAAAAAVASLTHADPLGIESAVLWSEAVRVAVTEGRLDLLSGVTLLPRASRDRWALWIDQATGVDPHTYGRNGFTVWALQAAWAAITWTPTPELDPANGSFPAQHLAEATKNAVRAGDDTDTVAAIAGGLLGAYWGQSAVPLAWTRRIHGYGDHRARGLTTLAHLTANRGEVTGQGWPTAPRMTSWEYTRAPQRPAPLPLDPDVVLGTYQSGKHGCDAIVSLCRVGTDDVGANGVAPEDHVLVRLVDTEDPDDNPNLEFVIDQAARAVAELRDEGKSVLLHCVASQQRTPSVAVAYGLLRGHSLTESRDAVRTALPRLRGHGRVWDAVEHLAPFPRPLVTCHGMIPTFRGDDRKPSFEVLPGDPSSRVVLHVPHASRFVPGHVRRGLTLEHRQLEAELDAMTDAFTDVLAERAAALAGVRPWIFVNRRSRLVIDPERFPDEREEMNAVGMGAVYTRTSGGGVLRDSDSDTAGLIEKYFDPYAAALADLVQERLEAAGRVTLLDVHSFPVDPLPYELHADGARPEICLGSDAFHTPRELVEAARLHFAPVTPSGDIGLDTPFAGTYVPLRHYGLEAGVRSLMLEIRRDLLTLDPRRADHAGIDRLAPGAAALIDHLQEDA